MEASTFLIVEVTCEHQSAPPPSSTSSPQALKDCAWLPGCLNNDLSAPTFYTRVVKTASPVKHQCRKTDLLTSRSVCGKKASSWKEPLQLLMPFNLLPQKNTHWKEWKRIFCISESVFPCFFLKKAKKKLRTSPIVPPLMGSYLLFLSALLCWLVWNHF